MQQWAITLFAYSYTIEYKPGSCFSNADAFSRLSQPHQPKVVPTMADTIYLLDSIPVLAALIKQLTQIDPILSKVKPHLLKGWTYSSSDLYSYFRLRSELSVEGGCVLHSSRVVVSIKGCAKVLDLLHETCPGVNCMKCLAQEYVWWPKIDCDIEQRVKSCNAYQTSY